MKNLFFITLILMVFSCGESQPDSKATSTTSASSDAITTAGSTITEHATGAANAATDAMTDMKDGAADMAADKMADMKDGADKAMDKMADMSADKMAEVKAKGSSIKDKISSATAKAPDQKEAVQKKMNDGKAKVDEMADMTKKEALDAKRKLEMAAKEKAAAAKRTAEAKVEKVTKPVVEKPVVEAPPKVEAPKPAPIHDQFDALLRKHISSSGKVNYNGFKADEGKLDKYTASLEASSILKSGSRNEKLAFWINAYNAYTIKLILKNHPVSSITDLHGGKPWDVKWIKLDGRTLSLNNIENDIVRPTYKDGRIHFAVNCAAKSCPPILNRAWTARNVNSNMEKQAKLFINNSSYNTISADNIEVSKIFEWYAADFGDLITYLNKYSNTKINSGAKIGYKEYNWKLNN